VYEGYRVQHNMARGPMRGSRRRAGQPHDLEDRGRGCSLRRRQRRH
jgi:glutamate dehydrogenase/leucine dehydrogenase